MCGFFGWLKFHEEFSDECLVKARNATSLLFHRGPDDRGEWIGKGIFMGHQRLKIIELHLQEVCIHRMAFPLYRIFFE